jgi:hypothetical protein
LAAWIRIPNTDPDPLILNPDPDPKPFKTEVQPWQLLETEEEVDPFLERWVFFIITILSKIFQ